MKTYINPPRTPVTEGSQGLATATLPNVCKMPGPPAPFVPVPLPNIGKSGSSPKGYTKNVTIEGNKVAIKGATFESVGDLASKGTGGGLFSANTHGPTSFVGPGSLNVKIEGKSVQFLGDPMLNNCGGSGNPPNAATLVGVLQAAGLTAVVGDEPCPLCRKQHGDNGKLEEEQDTKGAMKELEAAVDRTIAKARAQNASQLAAAQTKLTSARAARAALPSRQRKDVNTQIDALQKEIHALEVRFAGMMGVVKCKDDGIIFAGTSSYQYIDLQAEMPAAWHSPKGHCNLSSKLPLKDFKPDFSDYAKYGKGTLGSWAVEWEKLQQLSGDSYNGVTDEMFYPPGACAAQQMVLLSLNHGDRPMGLTENYYSSDPNPKPLTKLWIRKPGKYGPKRARLATAEELGPGKPIPPCGTCQVILTMLLCFEGENHCTHQAADPGVCHKC